MTYYILFLMMLCIEAVLHRLINLNARSLVGASIWEAMGKLSLAGGCTSVWVSVESFL